MLQQQDEMARRAYEARVKREMMRKAQSQNTQVVQEIQKKRQTGFDENDPLGDIESTPVVETEAFSMITEEMIREAINQQKIRTPQQKINELKQRPNKNIEKLETVQKKEVPTPVSNDTNPIDELEVDELERMTRNLQKELAAVRQRMKEKEE